MNLQKAVLAAAACAIFSMTGLSLATAQPYPFCRNGEGGSGDCRYDTLAQCQAAISGTAGYCQPNLAMPAPDQSRPARSRARRSSGT